MEEIARSLSHTLRQHFQTSSIVQLKGESDKEADVLTGVNKVPSWALVLRLPNLDGHGLGKNLLRELVLCT